MFEDLLAGLIPDLYENLGRWFEANRQRIERGQIKVSDVRQAWRESGSEQLLQKSFVQEQLASLTGSAFESDPFTSKLVKRSLKNYRVELGGVLKNAETELTSLARRMFEQPFSQSQLASEVQRITGNARGQAITVGNTMLAQAQQQVVNQTAASAGFEPDEMVYVYQGPDDGTSRGFCQALVGLAVTDKQMRRLDNGQGLPVKDSGGGWNCRHSWTPMTKASARAGGFQLATDSDIANANAAA